MRKIAEKEIRFRVDLDVDKANKQMAALKKNIFKMEDSINKSDIQHNAIAEQLKTAQQEAIKTYERVEAIKKAMAENQKILEFNKSGAEVSSPEAITKFIEAQESQKKLSAELAEQEKLLQKQEAEAQKLEEKDAAILKKREQQTAELKKQQIEAGTLQKQIEKEESALRVQDSVKSAKASLASGAKMFLKYAIGARTVYAAFNMLKNSIKEGVTEFAKYDTETQGAISRLKSALSTLTLSWGAAFAPIITAVEPLLQRLISWLTKAANAVAAFFAALSGKNSYKKVIAGTADLSHNLSTGAAAAKEMKRQLMGFDQLNVMQGQDTAGGGVGGGGVSGANIIDEVIGKDSIPAKLALSFKDVLLDWTDLNAEQIVEKVISGLSTLLGAGVGFIIGGVPGAVVGALIGFAISLVADSLIFDHDGQLSKDEVLNTLLLALSALVGGVIGFMIGGVPGALIGATIGLGVDLVIQKLKIEYQKEAKQWTDPVSWFLCDKLGLPTDQQLLQWGKDAINWIKQGLSDLGTELYYVFVDPWIQTWNDIKSITATGIKKLKDAFNFQISLPHIKLPHIEVGWTDTSNSSIAKLLGISALPRFSINWYAKGGIVPRASLFGNNVVGEDGKEAIIPLERHTEWISMVAGELKDMLFDGKISALLSGIKDELNAIPRAIDRLAQLRTVAATVPMPAVVMGTVAPPRAVGYEDNTDTLRADMAELKQTLRAFYGLFSELMPENNRKVQKILEKPIASIDGRQIRDSLDRYDRARGR